ncbi:MAG: DUF1311 domain-containing protein [Candidatus Marithrix sp.]|nr:DUF1311 domain-containing protein [Candidatus Marithrix sp.]
MAANFDCEISTGLTNIEKMICADPKLSQADEDMGQGYYALLRQLSDDRFTKKMFINDQREWLVRRNKELLTCPQLDCEIQFYNLRAKLLYPIANIDCKINEIDINNNIVDNDNYTKTVASKPPAEIICSNRLLRHAEGKILELYTPLQKELAEDQTEWLKLRDKKLKSCDLNCIWQFYKERIKFLIFYNFDEPVKE